VTGRLEADDSNQAFLLLGYDQGVMSGLVGADNRFGRDFGHPDANLQGDIVALYDIGCIIGSILVFFIGERYGRRWMLMAGGIIMIIGTIILASSNTVAQLIVGRIVTGVVRCLPVLLEALVLIYFAGEWHEQQYSSCLSE
jgi:MFS family permease